MENVPEYPKLRKPSWTLMLGPLILIFCFRPLTARGTPDEKLNSLANSPAWLHLLHYLPTDTGFKSSADGENFFFATNGKLDPLAELVATVDAFSKNIGTVGETGLSPICAFPARFFLLSQHFSFNQSTSLCEEFNQWKSGLDGHSISVIFASSHPNSPASMFGHTFLRINKRDGNEGNSLLSYGVSYAAFTGDANPFEYFWKGVTGGFSGHFSAEPYYMKLRDYASIENRDIWEYTLKLSETNIQILIAHLWELYAVNKFDYFFFDENCAYHITGLIQASRPETNLIGKLKFIVLPIETVRTLEEAGLVASTKHRISPKKEFLLQYDTLSDDEKKDLIDLINLKMEPNLKTSLRLVDATISYWHFQKVRNEGALPAAAKVQLKNLLFLRAGHPKQVSAGDDDSITAVNKVRNPGSAAVSPSKGHGPSVMGFEARRTSDVTSSYFVGRLGVHDFLDAQDGYDPHFSLVFSEAKIKIQEGKKIRPDIEKLTIVEATSLTPRSVLDMGWSWNVDINVERRKTVSCDDCRYFAAGGGVGLARKFEKQKLYFYSWPLAFLLMSPKGPSSSVAETGLLIGTLWHPSDNWRVVASLSANQQTSTIGKKSSMFFRANVDQSISLTSIYRVRMSIHFDEQINQSGPTSVIGLSRYF